MSYKVLNLYNVKILLFNPGLFCIKIGNPIKNHTKKNIKIIIGKKNKSKIRLNTISKNLLKKFWYID